jgi:hypothetical protein
MNNSNKALANVGVMWGGTHPWHEFDMGILSPMSFLDIFFFWF